MSSSDVAFWNLDQDQDGSLTQTEFVASRGNEKAVKKAENLFTILDQDRDGKLTLNEFTKRPPQARFLEYDRDGDGILSAAEYQYQASEPTLSAARAGGIFQAMDQNGDSKVSYEEYQRRWGLAKVMFLWRDASGDGRLSLEELVKGSGELPKNGQGPKALAAMDANHDGVLDEKEYAARMQVESFFRQDANGDGVLEEKEYLVWSHTAAEIAAKRAEFAQRDTDRDGRLSLEEFVAVVDNSPEAVFRRRDTSGDGKLSLEEYLAGQKDAALERDLFKLLDADGDGALTFAESRSNPPRGAFRRIDRDGDGTLSVAEYQATEAGLSAARAPGVFQAMDTDGDGKLSFEEHRDRWRSGKAMFLLRDTNGDGRLSLEELVKGSPELAKNGLGPKALAAMDTNHDGVLDEKEYAAQMQVESFFRRDASGDGVLDVTEYLVWSHSPEETAAKRAEFAQRDADRDGRLSLEESVAVVAVGRTTRQAREERGK
jgi:Ca2+-binding EF-hand superfamily protein